MTLTTVEILAAIMIVIGIVKTIAILTVPDGYKNFARKIYSKSAALKIVAVVLAAIILYFLVNAGVTVVEILAITLFVSLLMVVALADYGQSLIEEINFKSILKEQWLYSVLWLALIVWGIYEIFCV